MSNIATLGLEFKADKATERIQKLCDKFDELSKKTDSIQEVFNSLSTLKPLNNTFVTQISAVGNALNSLNKINPEIATKITAITSAIATMPYMSLDGATKIAAFAQSLNGIKIDAATSQTFHDISGLMANLRPVPPTVSDSLHQFASAVNNIQPIKPEIVQSIQAVMSVSSSVGGTATGQQDLNALADTLKKFKGIKPEVAVSIKELFNTLESVKNIDANTTQSVANLGDATRKFQAIKPNITVSVEKLFSAMGYLPNIDADKANAIANLGDATRKFQAIKPNIAQSVDNLFQTIANIKNIPYNITDNVNKLGEGLQKFKAIKPEVAQSVKNLFDTLSALKPVSANLRISIQMLTDMFNAMAAAGRNASGATKTLGQSMGFAQTQTDGLSIAFRTLQGAVSLNFFKSATAQAVEFGTELAQLKSIASELNTSQIGKGVMNFSSVLGNPRENLEALYYAYSSGIRGTEDDFLKFTDIVKKTAVVNRASVIPMADAMTAAMNAYGLSVDHVGEVADTFYSIVKYGKASGEQLANSFGQVSPTAKTLGVSLDELGAAIASLTKIQPTRVAITGLNNMLSKILKPTKQSRLALQRLGVDMSYSAVQSKGFVNVLKEVREALNGNMEEIKNIFPDIRGQRAAMQLLGAGWEDFNTQLDNFANKKGAMQGAFDTFTKDTAVQIGAIPETIKKIVTEAGTMMTKFLTLGGVLTPIIAAFNNMSDGARKFFASITLVVGAYTAYKTVMFALQSLQAIQLKNEQALAAAQARKNALLAQEVALRNKLATHSAIRLFSEGNTIGGIGRTGAGFKKGFGAMFDIKGFYKSIKFAGSGLKGFSAIIKGTFAQALTYAGAILGKVATVITTVFSAANMIIGGVVAIAAVGLDYLVHGSYDKMLTTDAVEGIYNWVTGTADKIKEVNDFLDRTRQNIINRNQAKLNFNAVTKDIELFADSIVNKSISKKIKSSQDYLDKIIPELQKQYSSLKYATDAYDAISMKEYETNAKLNDLQLKRSELLERSFRLSQATDKRFAEVRFTRILPEVRRSTEYKQIVTAYEILAEIEKEIKDVENEYNRLKNENDAIPKEIEEKHKKLIEQEEKFNEFWGKSKDQITRAAGVISENINALKEIQEIFKQQQIGDNKIASKRLMFDKNILGFKNAAKKEEYDVMAKALKAAAKNYNTIRNTAIKIGEDMAKLQMEGMLLGAKNDAQKQAIYSQKGINAFKEMKTALASGNLTAASKSLNVYIQNTKNAIAIQKKLADAEKQANNKTLQMIQSLDKFKVTAMEFVGANSTDAMKLQSRQFGALPKFTPLTTQQTSAQAANDKLATAIATYTQQISQAAEREKNNAEMQWSELQRQYSARITALESKLNGFLLQTSTALKNIVDAENKRQNQADNTKETNNLLADLVDKQKNVANNLQQISNKLNRGIEITNLKGQKALG